MRRRSLLLHACASAVNASGANTRFAKIAAVAFDGFAVFDPRPIAKLAEDTFPGKGEELGKALCQGDGFIDSHSFRKPMTLVIRSLQSRGVRETEAA